MGESMNTYGIIIMIWFSISTIYKICNNHNVEHPNLSNGEAMLVLIGVRLLIGWCLFMAVISGGQV